MPQDNITSAAPSIREDSEVANAGSFKPAVDAAPKVENSQYKDGDSRSIYDMFERDTSAEKSGVWLSYGPAGSFRIARVGGSNKKFQQVTEKLSRPYRRQIELGTIDEEVSLEIARKAFAQTIILDWKGVRDREGEPLPYNYDNCMKLLEDLPDLFKDLMDAAMDGRVFQAEDGDEELDSKN